MVFAPGNGCSVHADSIGQTGQTGQTGFVIALFVLPMLFAIPGTRPLMVRHRWPSRPC